VSGGPPGRTIGPAKPTRRPLPGDGHGRYSIRDRQRALHAAGCVAPLVGPPASRRSRLQTSGPAFWGARRR
jgi:hypothetical protein